MFSHAFRHNLAVGDFVLGGLLLLLAVAVRKSKRPVLPTQKSLPLVWASTMFIMGNGGLEDSPHADVGALIDLVGGLCGAAVGIWLILLWRRGKLS
jgi:hypothetical protein